VEEIIAVMRQAGNGIHRARVRGLIVVLWRAVLRINEALSLSPRLPGVDRRAQQARPLGIGVRVNHGKPPSKYK
jgi:hypothetical protein